MAKEKIRPPSIADFPGITPGGFRFLQQIAEVIRTTYGYKARAETSAADWVLANLTTDNAPHELDMSAVNAAKGAYAVLLRVLIRDDDAIGSSFTLRPTAWSGSTNVFRLVNQVAGQPLDGTAIIKLDDAMKFEYVAENVSWNLLSIYILGWFI